ncbi:hypothetical protein ACXM1Q_000610 [Streptococcus sp. 10F2]
MGDTKKHTVKIKPSKKDIERTYEGFDKLKELIDPSSNKPEAGFYILNGGKWFDDSKIPKFLEEIEVSIVNSPNLSIKPIQTVLCSCKKSSRKNRKQHPKNIIGKSEVSPELFHQGHLIADSIHKYINPLNSIRWAENFVMITHWCNLANTSKESCGMFYFENILLQTLDFYHRNKEHIEIDYRITPVFKKLDSKNEQQNYEKLPRGIIMEARVRNGGNFLTSNDEKHPIFESGFNVFIPNAQKNLKIDYNSGEVIKE